MTPPPHGCAWPDAEHIAAEAIDLGFDLLLGTAGYGNHHDHRSDTDDDAQHGQETAHLVQPQCDQRDIGNLDQVHQR